MPKRFLQSGVLFVMIVLVAASSAWAGAHRFTVIAEETSGGYGFGSYPSINSAGDVAFVRFNLSGFVWLQSGNGGPVTTELDTSGDFSGFGEHFKTSNNASGRIAFKGNLDSGGQGIYTISGGIVTTIVESTSNFYAPDISMNESGTVAYKNNSVGITYMSIGGGSSTPVEVGSNPSINDIFQVAYLGVGGVYRRNMLPSMTPVLMLTVSPPESAGPPSLNESGEVAVWYNSEATGPLILKCTGGAPITMVGTGGPFSSLGDPALNDVGDVAFIAYTDGSSNPGIYTGPDVVADKVIVQGDPLFCSTVSLLSMSQQSFNAAGQIVFYASLGDGRQFILRADPIASAATCGDMDGDHDRTTTDIDVFVAVLLGLDVNACHITNADMNGDTLADGRDVKPFVDCYLGA
jgi:hypothetical protein